MSAYIFIKPTDKIFQEFDNYEIGACALLNPSDPTLFDRCDADDPNIAFWSVFGHLKTGGLECISDHETFEEAKEFMEILPPMPLPPIMPFDITVIKTKVFFDWMKRYSYKLRKNAVKQMDK